MASGDTDISICSDALILLGAAPISSFADGTDIAQACERLYPDLRDGRLRRLVLPLPRVALRHVRPYSQGPGTNEPDGADLSICH